MNYTKLDTKAKKCMRITALILFFIMTIILISIRFIVKNNISIHYLKFIDLPIIACVILLLFNLFFVPNLRYKRYRYIITDDKIEIIEGAIFIEKTIIPIERIHQISVKQGPINRIYGLSKVTVSTAGSNADINFLNLNEADKISENLKNKINNLVIVNRELEAE